MGHERDRINTGKFLAKNNKFSNDMKPPPLPDKKTITMSKIVIATKEIGKEGERKREQGVKYSAYRKSVDGSFPCQPISFHCSDINP